MKKAVYFSVMILLMKFSSAQSGTAPEIETRLFEYVYSKKDGRPASQQRIVLLQNDSVQLLLSKSFSKAINDKWACNISLPPLTVRKFSGWGEKPRFKTKLEKKDPAKWYLFLQIFDEANTDNLEFENILNAKWNVKYKIIDGKNDSVITSQDFIVFIYRDQAPSGVMINTRLPGYPADYYKVFDSISTWAINDIATDQYRITLRPACFLQEEIGSSPLREIHFKNNIDEMLHETDPTFSLIRQSAEHLQTGKRKDGVGNTIGGVLTVLIGATSSKDKYLFYKVDYPFADRDQHFHCVMFYTDVESKEKNRIKNDDGSYSFSTGDPTITGRFTDSTDKHFILLDVDTIGWFNMNFIYEKRNDSKLWDGNDTTTIITLPSEWKHPFSYPEVSLSGELQGIPFSMHSTNVTSKKIFMLNNRPVAMINGYGKPETGILYEPLPQQQLKVFTILSALPYNFFRNTPLSN